MILISVLIGAELAGVLGALGAIPVTGATTLTEQSGRPLVTMWFHGLPCLN